MVWLVPTRVFIQPDVLQISYADGCGLVLADLCGPVLADPVGFV